ncbi:hypothetical protein GCM10028820_03340 [Tessaracoccus terricola]
MTASLHKLTAGSGYDYLTRQVAAQDTTEKGRASLASYYSEKGEIPGSWCGSGLVSLGDVGAGDPVSAEQMKALFGGGFHPNMRARQAALRADATEGEVAAAVRLGRPFPVHAGASKFQSEVALRCAAWERQHPGASEVPEGVRAEIRNAVATAGFLRRMGRAPGILELSSEVARLSRDVSTACAGFDVSFTPVKSVSALWAVAPPGLAAKIEEAHNAAVADALRFLEENALFSREGAGGVRQVDVTGLLAAAFVHRDSRAGDPNLHTHVAVANKVQTLSGKWLAIDGRLMFKAKVAISETYNSQLEAHLAGLGIRFAERAGDDPGKRPVREIVGVPAALSGRWSSRRAVITVRQQELAVRFQRDHHRPPTPGEALKLAQQATLETRGAKHEPRSLAEQRATWRAEAAAVIGEPGIAAMVAQATGGDRTPSRVTEGWVDATAAEVVAAVEQSRAVWQSWHLRAEASRRVREHVLDPATTEALTAELLRRALRICQPIGDPHTGQGAPAVLRRRDGSSMYSVAGSRQYTSARIVAAEQRIVELADRYDGHHVGEVEVPLALLASTANGVTLNQGQRDLVGRMAASGARVQLALAPAGSGKTTALRVLADAWREGGGQVLGLAPSAVAAGLLREQTGDADTVAKLVWDLDHNRPGHRIGPETLVVVDEAGMVDTISLARVIDHVVDRGGSVRLVGDDQQLAAVNAGGVLRDIATTHGAVELTELMRFTDPAEAAASLALREGRPEALGYYLDQDRIHAGTGQGSIEAAFQAWTHDIDEGLDSLMLASTKATVADLNRLAREHRLATSTGPSGPSVVLGDGNHASRGDVIVTRMNARRLPVSATDWVKNGDRWSVEKITKAGIRARHRTSGLLVTLPAAYVVQHVQLGYAVTVHCAQGVSVDVTRGVLSGAESRQQLYVMMTRGRHANHIYTPIVGDGDEHSLLHPNTLRPETCVDVVENILARDEAARSATTAHREATAAATQLRDATVQYLDGLHVAAADVLGAENVKALDREADQVVDGLTDCPAWTTLRAALLLNSLFGHDPIDDLRAAAAGHELDSAKDPAAVLTWRIHTPTGGPLPWLPPIPDTLNNHPDWGRYLSGRAGQIMRSVRALAAETPAGGTPPWVPSGQQLTTDLITDVETWRATVGVDPSDRRPTGPVQFGAARLWQGRLESRLEPDTIMGTKLLAHLEPALRGDPFAATLSRNISRLHGEGVPIEKLLGEAIAEGPLPVEHAAAALWWRLSRHLDDPEPGGEDLPGRHETGVVLLGSTVDVPVPRAVRAAEPHVVAGGRAQPVDRQAESDRVRQLHRQNANRQGPRAVGPRR